MRKVILYEINEVPWRVVDDFVQGAPRSAWARLVRRSASYTSVAPDTGELSPWITWPSLHRGVSNEEHNIAFLGQDPSTFRYEPIWQIARRAGRSIGVFGSLQSWPVPTLGEDDFYVPDTFARDATCHPPGLSEFQSFNLVNVRENGRVVRSRLGIREGIRTAWRLRRLGLRTGTASSAFAQLVAERVDRRYGHRRAVFQGRLAFDIFLDQWRKKQPDLATFFTNHVAGLQHRYWQAKYPDDYPAGTPALDPFFGGAIDYGMQVADAQLRRLMRLADHQGAILVVASSMGQEAVHKDAVIEGELQLRSIDRFVERLGLPTGFTRNLAMEPQIALDFTTAEDLALFEAGLARVQDEKGRRVFACARQGLSLSVTIHSPPGVVASRHVHVASGGRQERMPLEELGVEVIHPDSPGTAYHEPEGILLFYGAGVAANGSRASVSTLDVAPTLLSLLEVSAPQHMRGRNLAAAIMGREADDLAVGRPPRRQGRTAPAATPATAPPR